MEHQPSTKLMDDHIISSFLYLSGIYSSVCVWARKITISARVTLSTITWVVPTMNRITCAGGHLCYLGWFIWSNWPKTGRSTQVSAFCLAAAIYLMVGMKGESSYYMVHIYTLYTYGKLPSSILKRSINTLKAKWKCNVLTGDGKSALIWRLSVG